MNLKVPRCPCIAPYWHLTDIQVTKYLALAKGRMKQRAIATEIRCSKSMVGRITRRYQFETFAQRTPTPGPTLKTSISDNRHLLIIAKCNFDRLLQDITNLSGLPISRYTTSCRRKPTSTAAMRNESLSFQQNISEAD